MTRYTPTQLYGLARDAGLDTAAAVIAAAIAMAESGGDSEAVGDQSLANDTWGPSVGLWQIRSMRNETGLGSARDVDRLTDPAFNARSMVAISRQGTDWSPWSVYKNGAYRSFLNVNTDTSNPFAGASTSASGAVDESLLDQLNPFDDWQSSALSIGVKIAATGVALALAVVGLNRAVGG